MYGTKDVAFTLKVRMLKAEELKALLYACVARTPDREHFAEVRTVHNKLLLRKAGFQRSQRTDQLVVSYATALKKAPARVFRRQSVNNASYLRGQ